MCDRTVTCPVYDEICEGCRVARLSGAELRRRRQAERAERSDTHARANTHGAVAPAGLRRRS